MKRKTLITVILAGLLLLLTTTTGAAQEKVLVVGISSEQGGLDPLAGGSPRTTEIVSATYEQPVTFTTQTKDGYSIQTVDDIHGWQPLLAESVDVSADGRIYTFHLRHGVRFYPSGNEMTAKDWVWSWQRQLSDPPIGWGQFENKEASIVSPDAIKALDNYTVEVTTERANPRTLPFIRLQMFSIIDSEIAKSQASKEDPWATEWLAQNTAGTGPYYISARDPGQQLVLSANPYYWGEKPAYDKVIIKTIKETATRLALISRGDIDIATAIPARFTERMRSNPGVNVLSVPSGNRVYIAFNVTKPPFDNLLLRKAIAYAVPYDALIKSVYFGSARRYDSFVLPEVPGYSGSAFDYRQDLAEAERLLKESGVDKKQPLTLQIDASSFEHEQTALLLQDYLGRIGLRVEIDKVPSAEFSGKVFAKEMPFFIHEGISWIDDPSTIAGLWMESGAYGNFTKFSSPQVDELQAKWQFEPYGSERNEAYATIQRLYNEDLNAIYLVLADHIVLTRENVQGFTLYKDTGIRFKDLYFNGR